jgi:multidrug efflux pump subunit AcrB
VAYRDGAPVRVRDIGRAVDAAESTQLAAWAQGKPAVLLAVSKLPGANVIDTVDQIKALLPALRAAGPAALLVIYLILGVLYESYVHPLTIFSTLPSAGPGALIIVWSCSFDFTMIALIGVILLMGIVKKNGIMLVDFVIAGERDLGLPPEEAVWR